jgi:hypothetical protein
MAKDYCKWPVIVAIIIGVLILASVFMCILQCCGCACACLKCFADCFSCCCCCSCCRDSSKKHERLDDNPAPAYRYPTPYGAPAPNQYANPYQAQAMDSRPSMDTRPVNQQYRSNLMPTMNASTQPERPQFATFDSTRAVVNEDALPPMPMYKEGRDIHVEVEEQPVPQKQGDVELERLDRNGSVTSGTAVGMAAIPAGRRPPEGRSPTYGSQQNDSFVTAATPLNGTGPYSRPYDQQDNYRRASPAQKVSPVYGAGGGYAQQQPYGRGQPQAYGEGDGYAQQQPYGRGQPQAYESQDRLAQYNSQPAPYNQRSYYDEPDNRYQSPPPPNSNPYGYNTNAPYPSYDNSAPAPASAPQRLHTPGYASSESTTFEQPAVSAYPGQRSYTPVSAYPGQQQQPYRAFTPQVQEQQQQQQQQQPYTNVPRKPLDGTYRDL